MQKAKSYKLTPLFYCLANGFFYAALAGTLVYTTVYLSSKGISDSGIAFVVSISSLLALLTVLILLYCLDKYPRFLSKFTVMITTGISAIAAFLAVHNDSSPTLLVIYFTIAFLFSKAAISALGTVSVKSNIHISYTIPRGIGSAAYAVACLIAGLLTRKYGADVIMALFIPMMALSTVCIMLMPEDHIYVEQKKDEKKTSYFTMVKNNKVLFLFLAANFFNGVGGSCAMTFLIRIIQSCGGDSSNLGIATFIQALAEVPMTFFMAHLIKKYKFEDLLTFAFFMYAVRFFLISVASSIAMVYWAVALNMFCIGIYSTSSVRFAKLIVKPEETARSQALMNFFSGAGMGTFVGAAIQSFLIDVIGPRGIFRVGAAVALVGFVFMFICRKAVKKSGYANPDM